MELEKEATERRDFVGGVLHPTPRPTARHERIVGNIYRRLAEAAEGGVCRVYMNDMKVRIGDDLVYHPDVMVARGPEPEHPGVETAPCLLVEVFPPETREIDRREKVAFYPLIPSLKAYLLVEENRPVVERFFRDEKGKWGLAAQFQTGSFPVPCPETRLSLAEVFEGL
ncbi:MAG: Uma2 family endonuclease [Rubrobacteraceae bacterium]